MITLDNVSISYGKSIVIKNLNAKIEDGSKWFIIGPNGSGKSTFLKSLIGLVNYKGTIKINGSDLRSVKKINTSTNVKEAVNISSYLTVSEFIKFHTEIRGYEYSKAINMLEELKMSEILHFKIGKLSTGQEKMAYNIAAIATNSDLVILDEPFETVDPWRVEILSNIIKENVKSYIIVSHIIDNLSISKIFNDTLLLIFFRGNIFGPIGKIEDSINLYVKIGSSNNSILNYETDMGKISILRDKEEGSVPLYKMGDIL
ncbi:MAG: ATP-binding cassette domain-containing protein [Thermoplasmata archaeon]